MFNVEPQEEWTTEDAAEFEAHVALRQKRMLRGAVVSGTCLLLSILIIIPSGAGFPLYRYWEQAKFLIYGSEACFLWFVLRVSYVWSSWQSARETRREFGDPK